MASKKNAILGFNGLIPDKRRLVMKNVYTRSCVWFLVLLLMVPVGGFSQDTGPQPPVFRQEELDQMLAPIALYTDALLIQILIAATYPLEVVQASRWVTANPHLKGEQLAITLEQQNWDPSVKSLVNFPSVLGMMNDKLEWTQNLGDAFLAQQDQVMATVQNLRQKAYAQGNLKTTSEQVVVVQGKTIVIDPADPQVIYVPVYNPAVVYGAWWYPSYPPYYYYPPGYVYPYAYTSAAVYFGIGVAWGFAWSYAYGCVYWPTSQVYVYAPPQNVTTYNTYNTYNTYATTQTIVNSGQTTTATGTSNGTRTATATTISGKSVAYAGSTVKNADGSVTTSGAVAGSGGNTASRSATTAVDSATNTVNRNVTGPGGQTRTVTATADGSGNRSAAVATDTGKSAAYTGSTVKNADGSVTNTGVVAGSAGNTIGRSATTAVDPETGSMDRTVTGPGGQTRTVSGDIGTTGTMETSGTTGATGQTAMAQSSTTGQAAREWQHDPSHRKGVTYKDPSVRQQFGQTRPTASTSSQYRGFDQNGLTSSSVQQRKVTGTQNLTQGSRQTGSQTQAGTGAPNATGSSRQGYSQGKTATGAPSATGSSRQGYSQGKTATVTPNATGSSRQGNSQGRTAATTPNTAGSTRQTYSPRTGATSSGTGGQSQLRGTTGLYGSTSGRSSTTFKQPSASAIESLNRGGSEVKQQSIRGRSSRESLTVKNPVQSPTPSFQGGKVSPGVSIPRSGSGSSIAPNIGSGGAGLPRGGGGFRTK